MIVEIMPSPHAMYWLEIKLRRVNRFSCVATDADIGTLHECREFINITCPDKYVIEIQPADVDDVQVDFITTVDYNTSQYADHCERYDAACPMLSVQHLLEIEKICNKQQRCSVPRHFVSNTSCSVIKRISYKCFESKYISFAYLMFLFCPSVAIYCISK